MTETAEHPTPAALRHLSSLRDLSPDELRTLSERLFVHEQRKGGVLLPLGAPDDCTLYLLEGTCRLIAEDGGSNVVRHTDPSAHAPLARLRPSRYKVVAESPVRYLRIDNALIEQTGGFEQSSSLSLESYQVEEQDDTGYLAAENRLTVRIFEDLNADHLLLPSLPSVALRIGDAVNDERTDAGRVAGLIETDPAIALKIVKAANSARFGGVAQTATVTEAVTRLGLHNTRILVITFALRELFRTDSPALGRRMQTLWEHSRRIAALTRVLGDRVGVFNAHEALLAGLIHDIGGVALLGYARDFPEVVADPAALELSMRALRSQLGSMILAKWRLPEALVAAAKDAEHWYRERSGGPDYADLVIVAQLHEGVGGDIDPARVPAFGRLGLAPTEIDRGLDLLHEAHEEVARAREMVGG